MSDHAARHHAGNVVAFPAMKASMPILSFEDRETLRREMRRLGSLLQLSVSVHAADEVGEFAVFSFQDESSSSWCLGKKDGFLLLWNSRTGADLGVFATMYCVLNKLAELSPLDGVGAAPFEPSGDFAVPTVVCFETARAGRLALLAEAAALCSLTG